VAGPPGLNAIALQPRGDIIGMVSQTAPPRLWNLKTDEVRDLAHDDTGTAVSFSPGGRLVATSSYDGTVRLWDVRTGGLLSILERVVPAGVMSVAFSPDGRRLAAADNLPAVHILGCEICRPVAELVRLANARVKRSLTPAQRSYYIGGGNG
jgi:WD40 repeat protein